MFTLALIVLILYTNAGIPCQIVLDFSGLMNMLPALVDLQGLALFDLIIIIVIIVIIIIMITTTTTTTTTTIRFRVRHGICDVLCFRVAAPFC